MRCNGHWLHIKCQILRKRKFSSILILNSNVNLNFEMKAVIFMMIMLHNFLKIIRTERIEVSWPREVRLAREKGYTWIERVHLYFP